MTKACLGTNISGSPHIKTSTFSQKVVLKFCLYSDIEYSPGTTFFVADNLFILSCIESKHLTISSSVPSKFSYFLLFLVTTKSTNTSPSYKSTASTNESIYSSIISASYH